MKYLLLIVSITILTISSAQERNFSYKDGSNAVVLGSKVNVRASTSLKSKIVDQVNEGELVKFLQLTNKRLKIGRLDDFWAKIQTKSGKIGYMFGAYLFNLVVLYSPKGWNQDLNKDTQRSIFFEMDGSYSLGTSTFNEVTGKTESTDKKGTFSISGRRLNLSNGYKLYLSRCSGIHYLTMKKLPVNTKSFSTHCERQWKEYVEDEFVGD